MNVKSEMKWYLVSEVSLFPEREGQRVQFDGRDIAIFNLGNQRFKAIDSVCPHKQGPLQDGIVAGDDVFCPLHSWKISLETGCAAGEDGRVNSYPVIVRDDKVYVSFQPRQMEACSETQGSSSE